MKNVILGKNYNSSSQRKPDLIERNFVVSINAICIYSTRYKMTLKADAVLNNTTVSQFYVLFNFLCGKSVIHKSTAKENVEKVDSFHIYIPASTWK